jgi:hypothetical protein
MAGGRPTKLTPELAARVVKLIESGWWLEHAADEVGIVYRTLYAWIRDGESQEATPELAEFSQACTRARTRAERAKLKSAEDARSNGEDWKLETWQLERMNPKRYKPADKHEVTGADGGAMKIAKIVMLPPEDAKHDATGGGDPVAPESGAADEVPFVVRR